MSECQPCSLGHDGFYDILHLILSFCNLNFKRSCATWLMRGPGGEVSLPRRTCNHSRGREDAPREPVTPSFGCQTVETMSPKKLGCPQGSQAGEGKTLKSAVSQGMLLRPMRRFPTAMTTTGRTGWDPDSDDRWGRTLTWTAQL